MHTIETICLLSSTSTHNVKQSQLCKFLIGLWNMKASGRSEPTIAIHLSSLVMGLSDSAVFFRARARRRLHLQETSRPRYKNLEKAQCCCDSGEKSKCPSLCLTSFISVSFIFLFHYITNSDHLLLERLLTSDEGYYLLIVWSYCIPNSVLVECQILSTLTKKKWNNDSNDRTIKKRLSVCGKLRSHGFLLPFLGDIFSFKTEAFVATYKTLLVNPSTRCIHSYSTFLWCGSVSYPFPWRLIGRYVSFCFFPYSFLLGLIYFSSQSTLVKSKTCLCFFRLKRSPASFNQSIPSKM